MEAGSFLIHSTRVLGLSGESFSFHYLAGKVVLRSGPHLVSVGFRDELSIQPYLAAMRLNKVVRGGACHYPALLASPISQGLVGSRASSPPGINETEKGMQVRHSTFHLPQSQQGQYRAEFPNLPSSNETEWYGAKHVFLHWWCQSGPIGIWASIITCHCSTFTRKVSAELKEELSLHLTYLK